MTHDVKITELSSDSIDALHRWIPDGAVTIAADTATFHVPDYAELSAGGAVRQLIDELDDHGLESANLEAVAEKLDAVEEKEEV